MVVGDFRLHGNGRHESDDLAVLAPDSAAIVELLYGRSAPVALVQVVIGQTGGRIRRIECVVSIEVVAPIEPLDDDVGIGFR